MVRGAIRKMGVGSREAEERSKEREKKNRERVGR